MIERMNKILGLSVAALTVLAASIVGATQLRSDEHSTPVTPPAQSTPNPNPIAIENLRKRPLTVGAITLERDIAPRGGCRTQVISYPSEGFKQYALVQTPATERPATGYPTLVLAHGYIPAAEYSTERSDYQSWLDYYCRNGYYVQAVRAPIQIHHGEADEVVPVLFSRRLDDALTKAQKPHELYVYPGGDHQFVSDIARSLLLERTLAYLDAHVRI